MVEEGSSGPIDPTRIVDSSTSEYSTHRTPEPDQLSPVMGYYWPYIWVHGKPGAFDLDLGKIHDLVDTRELTQGLRAKVFRLGFFVFDFSNLEKPLPEESDTRHEIDRLFREKMWRVAVFNAHVVCLYNALAEIEHFSIDKVLISHEDVISMPNFDDPLSSMGSGGRSPMSDIADRLSFNYPGKYAPEVVRAAEMRWCQDYHSRIVIPDAVLNRSFELLNTILDHTSEHSLLSTEILAFSCKAFEDHNYSLSLVTAWDIIEKLLRPSWDRYIDENRDNLVELNGDETPLINAERAKLLRDGNSFTAAMITEFLTCLGLLPFAFYKSLKEVRSARNKWMHELRPVKRHTTYQGL